MVWGNHLSWTHGPIQSYHGRQVLIGFVVLLFVSVHLVQHELGKNGKQETYIVSLK